MGLTSPTQSETGKVILSGAKVFRHGAPWPGTDTALLFEDGQILGYAAEASDFNLPGTAIRTLPGGVLIPAFFDAHLHLDQGGRYLGMLPLRDATTAEAVLDAIRNASNPEDGWLIGIGLRETAWPTLNDLNNAAGDRALFLYTRDYHSAVLNREAMRRIGLDSTTPDPEGGWFDRDKDGAPTGVLHENTVMWAEKRLPEETPEIRTRNLKRAMEHLLGFGILGLSDASNRSAWPHLLELEGAGELDLRVEHWSRCLSFDQMSLEQERHVGSRLRRTRLKLFIDGALGSRTAWMKQQYSDQPGWSGKPVPDLDVFNEYLHRAVEAGWSLTVHAIGDAGVEHVVRHLAPLPSPGGPHRVEHVQHIDPVTLRHLADSPLIASIQPMHRVEDRAMLLDRIGDERAGWAFPMKSLARGGQSLVLGTDWPVVSAAPGETIRAALQGRGEGEGMAGEELNLEETLFAYSAGAAMAAGFAGVGQTEPGSPADLVWLPRDPGRDPDAWAEMEIGAVWAGGDLKLQRVDF